MNSVRTLHTFGLQANSADIVYIQKIEQLSSLVGNRNGQDIVILGQGSNTLFLNDYAGKAVVNQLSGIKFNESESCYELEVASGENWHELVKWCLSNGINGLENLALIPGTAGAAPIQNIGAYGVEVCEFVHSVEYFDLDDGKLKSVLNQECLFGYRDSIFKHKLKNRAFITKVHLNIPKHWQPIINYAPLSELSQPTAQQIFDTVCHTRKQKLPDPNVLGNAGSFFKNPVVSIELTQALLAEFPTMPHYPIDESSSKLAAGWLIDKAGLKGFSMENVSVHINQALVLVNKSGEACGDELLQLVKLIQQKVQSLFDVKLEPEVRLISSQGEITIEEIQ